MLPKRYAFVIADRETGTVHRFSLWVRPAVALVAAILAVPDWMVRALAVVGAIAHR